MKNTKLYNTTFDIIFEHRNKAYGAYALRKSQDKNLAKAIGLFLILTCILLLLTAFKSEVKKEIPIDTIVTISVIELPDLTPKKSNPPKMDIPKPKSVAKVKTVKFVPPVVLEDEEVENLPPPEDVLQLREGKTEIATISSEGIDGEGGTELPSDDLDFGIVETPKVAPIISPHKVYDFVEKEASFPGGEVELMKFLRENIIYPAIARENNIQGRVILRFIIETDGQISDMEILRKVEGGCTEEAIRVMEAMPIWLPANQNGNAVRQRMTLPIYFNLK